MPSAAPCRASARPRLRPTRTAALIAILGCLTGVAPLAIDMYIPGLPALAESLSATDSAGQLTITAFLIGIVAGQLLFGPLSDAFGRRPPLLAGSVAFIVTSLACAVAPTIELLIGARVLQGIAAGAGTALARAVIADLYSGRDLAKYFAVLAQILAITPVLAPIAGAAVLAIGDWRLVFVSIAAVGALLTLAVFLTVDESLPQQQRTEQPLRRSLATMGQLLRSPAFLSCALVLGGASGALFAYISGSSFLFQSVHGMSESAYAGLFAVNALGMLGVAAVFSRLLPHIGLARMMTIATVIALGVVLLATLASTVWGDHLALSWAAMFVATGSVGIIFPASMAIGQNTGAAHPGAASALLGAIQFSFGALAAPVVGLIAGTGSTPLLGTVAAAFGIALLGTGLLALTSRRHLDTADHREQPQ